MKLSLAAFAVGVLTLFTAASSYAGTCVGGSNNGQPCVVNGDCPGGGTCVRNDDHLKCYRMKDPHKFKGIVDLDGLQFGLEPGCRIKIRATEFCVPVEKTVVSDGGAPSVPFTGQSLTDDRLCYTIKCPRSSIADQVVTDQFGTRTLTRFKKAVRLCTPAMKGVPPGPCPEPCPEKIRFTVAAGTGKPCTTNADCLVGACNNSLGRCQTRTELDLGFTGLAQDQDIDDSVKICANLTCPGGGAPGPCGDCTVDGFNCDFGNCRCINNNRQQCTNPFLVDAACGGNLCVAYTGPPIPLSPGGAPVCVVNKLAQDLSGVYNVDSGAGTLDVKLSSVVYTGIALEQPCPYCNGDPILCDGVPAGTCAGGANNGLSCDAGGLNACFPAPGGNDVSLDCFPAAGSNVSGPGLKVDLAPLTTGSTSLAFATNCSAPLGALQCACAQCSGDPTIGCVDDSECAAVGAGLCTASTGAPRYPNGCDAPAFACSATALPLHAPDGTCTTGPDDLFCDGLSLGNGQGFLPCLSNTDCASYGPTAGDCTSVKRRECFTDPINATGDADPDAPMFVSTFCVPPTASSAVNVTFGYAGPGRLCVEADTYMPCPGDPGLTYEPGVGFQ